MLVVDVDRLGKRHAPGEPALSFQQKFAATVLTGFAVALSLLAVLFAASAESPSISRVDVRQLPAIMAADGAGVAGSTAPPATAGR